ncbi:MAG: Flp pilus assembly protein CpaB [Kiritimatiellae bacterium]|nr:Flp pilus assembly protein CpaB [Kiritimatiellia bacterium]
MKNFIPLVIAVLLGLAAVLAVSRLLKERTKLEEDTITVVAAARDIKKGAVLTDGSIMKKEVPYSARPAQAIYWSRSDMVVGQKAMRSISQSDYVFLSDVGLSSSMGDIVGEGEWAVALLAPSWGIGSVVQPGDEVAVIGTFDIKTKVKSADLAEAQKASKTEATLVLFPRVRILSVGEMGEDERSGTRQIIVALPPRQAQVLIAAARRATLMLALRRPGDESAISRIDSGMITDGTFEQLLEGLEVVEMPKIPGVIVRKRVGDNVADKGIEEQETE